MFAVCVRKTVLKKVQFVPDFTRVYSTSQEAHQNAKDDEIVCYYSAKQLEEEKRKQED